MYITSMKLDTAKRSTMLALITPCMFHGAVESAFSGGRKRRLWRIDRLNGEDRLIIVSEDIPDLSAAARQFGFPDQENAWLSKDYSPLLDRLSNGTKWRFRLTANPTISCTSEHENGQRGEVHAHVSVKQQEKWLYDRAEKHGFSLSDEDFAVVGSKWYIFKKGGEHGRGVTILAVTYEGILTINDANAFRELLINGIGRGKAYGMGMMTVISLF